MVNKYFNLIFAAILVCIIFFFGRDLNPFDGKTFMAHDETQAARVSEFALNITHGKIPPRISPNMSYGLGYPIFNYYAPFAYWVTSAIHLTGIPIIPSLEISYLLALIVGCIGIILFLRKYVSGWGSFIGGLLYISSPFVAVDIFVRGNLAEIWFLALFPMTLYLLSVVDKKRLFITAIVVSFLFSVHNIFSLLAVGILFVYSILIKNKYAFVSVVGGLLLSVYFLIPAIVELPFVHAQGVATLTQYADHFVCPSQLWYSPWGYGGSTAGCQFDGMSFMLGKLQLLMGGAGVVFLIWNLLRKPEKKHRIIMISVAILLVGSIFMTTKYSAPIWNIFEGIFSLFQFPWRFLLFAIFGLSFFGAYALSVSSRNIPKKIFLVIVILLSVGILGLNAKFFHGNNITEVEYNDRFISSEYITNVAAYKVAEYLPISADYDTWRLLENSTLRDISDIPKSNGGLFERKILQEAGKDVVINIHNAQYWTIASEGEMLTPESYDAIGRPIIAKTDHNRKISVTYHQTLVQQIGNGITLLSGILLISYSYLWNKNQNTT